MPLQAGTLLGHYSITAAIGAGGMGEVYRARDTKLDREVAIKVLPASFAEDEGRVARFEREAKALAAFNHPNIATIHGFEERGDVKALVLELVEGPTLAERIAEGPLAIDETLAIARQIALALEAAHEQGIIHRDLKPANIKMRPDGVVKVLDFGLAKALQPLGGSGDPSVSQSPTITAGATELGVVMGTVAYMAPEQARGQPVDRRADIWAFGCVVFEMLSGRRAFGGGTAVDVATAVVSAEPDWTLLPSSVPPALRRILLWCLQKDTRLRLQHVGDGRVMLGEVEDGGPLAEEASAPAVRPSGWSRRVVAAWVVSVLITAAATWWSRDSLSIGPPTGSAPADAINTEEIRLRQLTGRPSSETVHSAALSPDGEQLAFATQEGIFLQIIETGEERLLLLPEELQVLEVDWLGTTDLLFSASSEASYGLYRVSVFGGTLRRVADGAWRAAVSPDASRIAYLEGAPSRLVRVSDPDGEDPRTVLDLGSEGSVWEIAWSPDSRWLLVGRWGGSIDPYDTALEAIDLESESRKERREVVTDMRFFQNWRGFLPFFWTAEDRLILGRRELEPNGSSSSLWQVPIDRATATIAGEVVPLLRLHGANPKDLSATSDGSRFAFLREHSQDDVMVGELLEDNTRLDRVIALTSDERQDSPLGWGRDSQSIIFQSTRTGAFDVFRKPLDGKRAEFLADRGADTNFLEVSDDGSSFAFFRGPELIRVPTQGGPAETLLRVDGAWPGISCDSNGERCLVGSRSPDSSEYVFHDFSFESGQGDEALRIKDHPPFTNWDVSPDGSTLVVAHRDDRLRLVDILTGEEEDLTHEVLSYGEFPVWSADGRGIFVDGGYPARGQLAKGLLYVSLDDGEAQVLRLNWGEWNHRPRPSPDGQRLAFAANFFYDANAWMLELPVDR